MNKWDLIITQAVRKFLDELKEDDRSKVKSLSLLFKEYGTTLPAKYLKRLSGTRELWELRAKRIRVFLVISGNVGIAVHAIIKKSQRTPKQDIDLAAKRAIKAKEDLL